MRLKLITHVEFDTGYAAPRRGMQVVPFRPYVRGWETTDMYVAESRDDLMGDDDINCQRT